MVLTVTDLTKRYAQKTAVDHLSFTLTPGVTGLLGANGAGKTTLMRLLCGILRPTEGSIKFDGADVNSEEYRNLLGYLPQDFGYYPEFSGRSFLLYMAALKGLGKAEAKSKTDALLRQVNLTDAADKKVKTYSGGMKQRLGIAQALLNDPKLIILDEPTAGLDPRERVHFRSLIAELGQSSVVLLSTHIVSDVERIAERILMMKDGKIIWDGAQDTISEDLEQFYLQEFGGADDE